MNTKLWILHLHFITVAFIIQAQYGIITCASNNATLFPEGVQVINTTYNYVDVRWNSTHPSFFLNGSRTGYIVAIEKLGDPDDNATLIFTSCHAEGINITNLEEDTTYCVYVAAFTAYGKGNSTSCIVSVTGEKPKVDFTAFNESSTSIRLNWDAEIPLPIDGGEERGIKIDYYPSTEEKITRSVLFCDENTTYVFSNLSIFTNYCFGVVAYKKDEIDTKLDNKKCVFTDEEAPGGPPLNVTARNVSSTGINVTWELIEEKLQYGIILGYRISYKKEASSSVVSHQCNEAKVLGGNNRTWILEGLEKFTNYCIQIVGFNSKGDGNISDSICVLTDEDVPSMPPNITAGFNISTTGLKIEWSHIPPDFTHGNLLGYEIFYKMSSEADSMSIPIDTEPHELSKNITGLLVYTEYCVRIAGRTRIGTGIWSDCFNITTDEDVPSSPPIDVTVIEGTTPDTINISWKPPEELNGKLTGYKVMVNNTLANGTLRTKEFMTCTNYINLTGIDKKTEYNIKVAASTRKGLGPFSECVEYGEVCECPEILQVVAKPESSTLDGHQGEGSLTALIESLIIEACGYCDHYEDGKTKINRTGDADITFPIIKYLSKIPPSTSESRFVTVIQVPGLAVLQRKTEKDLGFYEKVMGSSVVHSWPIFAIFGTMTLAAGMVIWVLDVNTNPEEFPPTFHKGAGEGLWWAFITMTTLGYGDRTPKSDPSKAFAMIWMLVGLVMFGLFAGAVTASLTVVVANGGPNAADEDKLLNISTLKNSPEKYVVVSKLSNKFQMGTEYETVEELIGALKSGRTDAILLDMYVQMKRQDIFNDSSGFKVVEIVNKEIVHGIELRGVTLPLAKRIEEYVRENNVQTDYLEDTHPEDEDEEEHEAHSVTETEEESLVFFEPGSPFFSLTLKAGGAAVAGFILCGIIFEICRRKVRKDVKTGRYCQDEEEMRKMVEEFYRDFSRTYTTMKKKNKHLINLIKKFNKKGHTKGSSCVKTDVDSAAMW